MIGIDPTRIGSGPLRRILVLMRAAREPFVGRKLELERLERSMARVIDGAGVIALVRGEPGVGKTRVAAAFADAIAERATVLWGACLGEAATPAFGPWYLAFSSSSSRSQVAEAVNALGSLAAVLAPVLPWIAQSNLLPAVPLGPAGAKLRLYEALTELLRQLARSRPLVVVLDDVHWMDSDSLDLLLHLFLLLPRERWLFVLTARDAASREAVRLMDHVARMPNREHLELSGLTSTETAALMAELLEVDVAPEVAAAVHAEASGIPFYVQELARSLGDGGPAPAIPRSVHDALAARFAPLSPPARELLTLLASLSRPVEAPQLATVAGASLSDVLERLEETRAAGLVKVVGTAQYDVSHAIFRRAVLERLLPEREAVLRRRIADALASGRDELTAAEVATQYHLSRGLPGAEAGVGHAVIAATLAERAAAHDRAVRFWRIASDLTDSTRARADILPRLARAEAAALRFEDAAKTLQDALALDCPIEGMHLVLRTLKQAGAPTRVWEPLLDECVSRCSRRDIAWARLVAMRERVQIVATGPWYVSEWVAPDADAIRTLRASGYDADLAATVSPFAPRTRNETEALAARVESMSAGEERIATLDAVIRDFIHRHADYRRAETAASALLDESRRVGHVAGEAEALYELAKCRAILGDLDAARLHADAVPPLVARLGAAHRLRFTVLTALRFEISYFAGGEWAPIAEEALRFARDPRAGATAMGAIAMGFGALASALARDAPTAAAVTSALASVVRTMSPHAYQRKQAIDLAAVALWHAQLSERALEYRDLLLDAPREEGVAPVTCTDLGLARMAALTGDRRETQRRYARALAWCAERGAAPLAAIVRYEQGMAGGAPRGLLKARAEVEEALAAFVAMKMTPWVARAELALGAVRALPDGLTVREAEVLAHVANGLSNKEVAARLRIGVATVQRHLANAYSKIRVTSRSQATSYVLRVGLTYMADRRSSA